MPNQYVLTVICRTSLSDALERALYSLAIPRIFVEERSENVYDRAMKPPKSVSRYAGGPAMRVTFLVDDARRSIHETVQIIAHKLRMNGGEKHDGIVYATPAFAVKNVAEVE